MEFEMSLEELILDDMQEWVQERLLSGQDMYDYLDDIEAELGKLARKKELSSIVENYFKNHILPL
jgi:hypothetical protein